MYNYYNFEARGDRAIAKYAMQHKSQVVSVALFFVPDVGEAAIAARVGKFVAKPVARAFGAGAVKFAGSRVGKFLFGRANERSAFRRPNGAPGILNHGKLRVGMSWNKKRGREVFSVRWGKRHFDF
jgi:hypothetical protein